MRAVFVGASSIAIMATRQLLSRGHEVVMVERSRECIDNLTDELDSGFLHGDGSKPAVLRDADPKKTDVLFCLTGNDQANILASLVGRSLGFARVVTKIEDPELEHICLELGLEDTIVPARTIGRYLAEMFEGRDPTELSTMVRDEARAFSFVVGERDAGHLNQLELPGRSRIVCIYRGNQFILPDEGTRLKREDEVVIITHRDDLPQLEERWSGT